MRSTRAVIAAVAVCVLAAAVGGFLAVGHGPGRSVGLWLGLIGLFGCGGCGFRLGLARRTRRDGGAADTEGRP